VIDGQDAVTPTNLDYWGEERGVIKIGGANVPDDVLPGYVVLEENLDVRSARPPYSFTAADSSNVAYADNAAAIYVEKAEHLTIRRCDIHDSATACSSACTTAPRRTCWSKPTTSTTTAT